MLSSGNLTGGRRAAGACAALALLALAAPAVTAQSGSTDLYNEAVAREAPIRRELAAADGDADSASLLRRVRVLAGAYEDIARLFPGSGTADDALWRGGTLAADAYARFGEPLDRTTALRLLNALAARAPGSAFAKQVPQQLARLEDDAPRREPPGPRAAAPAPVTAPATVVEAPRAAPAPVAPVAAASQPAAAPPAAAGPVTLRDIWSETLPDVFRVTLDLERPVRFYEEQLQGPPRVFIDLQNTVTSDALKDETIRLDGDLVKQIRVGRHIDTRTRVVFDLAVRTTYRVYSLSNPYRIVFDFDRRPASTGKTAVAPAATAPSAPTRATTLAPAGSTPVAPASPSAEAPLPPAANASGGFSLSRQLGLGVTRIVIDPGHGGHDPGAQANGLSEAALVLDVALRLEKLLQKNGIDVVLTRRTNAFISLEERTAVANGSGADLFLSIHVNANAAASARGIETYVLDFASNPQAEALAARENAGSARSMRDLPEIVEAIARNNKADESRDFAAIIQSTLYQRLRRANRNLKNLGVKQAPFVVLIGASMPAILSEIAFMSNRQEAALLKTDKYRDQIADALLAGVLRYQQSLKKVPAVATAR